MFNCTYRPDQGVVARGVAFWAITIYAFLAGQAFFYEIQSWEWSEGWASSRIFDGKIPILAMYLTPALLLGIGVFLAIAYGVAWRLVNHPRIGDLLIETEAEMKKVTWPSWEDTKRSSFVVIGCVLFLLVYLFGADWLLKTLLFSVLAGSGGEAV